MAADKQALETPSSTPAPNSSQAGAEPSGYNGGNPSTSGPGQTGVHSNTPENSAGHLNPSSPEDSNITPGSGSDK